MATFTVRLNKDASDKLTKILRRKQEFRNNRERVFEDAIDMLYKFYEDRRWRN